MHDTDTIQDANPKDLIEFATRWTELGDAVTEQVAQVLDDPDCGSCWDEGTEHGVSPTAIRTASERLAGLNAPLDDALADFLERVQS